MKVFFWTILMAVALSGVSTARAADETLTLSRTALTDPWPFHFVEGLTTEIGQRLAGTEAEHRAAQWAVAHLKAAGFENVHIESFPMNAWIRGQETGEVVSPAPQYLVLTALGGSVATPPGGIEAPVALFHTYAEMLAMPPGSLNGKIAVVTQAMARVETGAGYGAAIPIRRLGTMEAASRGAVAYLIRSLSTDSRRFAHTGVTHTDPKGPNIPAAALAVPDAEQLERLAARGPVTLHLVLTPRQDPQAHSDTVSAEIRGSEHPDQIVLIGAHLDSWDLATGATDDGAGDAIVTGAARLILGLPHHPKRTIRVVLFGAEEMGVSGPAYASAHAGEASHIVAAAEADFGAGAAYAVQLPPGAAKLDLARQIANAVIPIGAFVDEAPAIFAGEDVDPLHELGVPVFASRQDGTAYFDTHHTADDTLDKVDPKGLAQNVGVWAAMVDAIANSDVDFRTLPKPAAP